MRYSRLDLNLLSALQALLSERSVSLAADRLRMSQSGMSSALGRLRTYFADELLVAKGRTMMLTPKAEALLPKVNAIPDQNDLTLVEPAPFDAALCDRTISIMCSDYVSETLIARAVPILRQVAPGLRYNVLPLPDIPSEFVDRRAADLIVVLDYGLSSDHPHRVLFEEEYVLVGAADNAAVAPGMTIEEYCGLHHVSVVFGKSRFPSFDESVLRAHKMMRKVVLQATTFGVVASIVANSDLVATMHRRMAENAAQSLPLKIVPLPFSMPPLRFCLQWHKGDDRDPGLVWLIDKLTDVAATIDQAQPKLA